MQYHFVRGTALRLLVPILLCGIAQSTSFTGPGSFQASSSGPPGPDCRSLLTLSPAVVVTDTVDGFRVTGSVTISSAGTPIGNCLIYMFFARRISEPPDTVLTSESSATGTVDAPGAFQLGNVHVDYLTYISGAVDLCLATAGFPIPPAGTGVPFSAGPVAAGPCTVPSSRSPVLQGVVTMFVNDQPGSLTLHFDSLRSEAHVQAIPEPASGLMVLFGLMASRAVQRISRCA
jgi:hypothetical protein